MSQSQDKVVAALPGYDIAGELGRGGWGVVLGARHRQLGREVAIKQLPVAFAADTAVATRFTSEARVLARLDHPHIVPVYDYVESDGLFLLVMERLPGGTVWDRFTTAGLTPATACAIVLAACSGLAAAHAQQILHRDVKPENLMFAGSGVLKVTDFGIAKVVGGEDTLATRAGEVVGTPAYIAPEQARGLPLSPATDVYAVATMLYEFLSGRLPFPDDGDAMSLLFKHAFEQPEPLGAVAPGVPAPVVQVVMAGLATEPSERPDGAEAFGIALAEACTHSWGAGWLSAEGTPVMGASGIVAATERSLVVGGSAGSAPPAPPTEARPQVPLPAPPTEARPQVPLPAPPTEARPQVPLPAPPPATDVRLPVQAVQPRVAVHAKGASLDDVDVEQLVAVREVVAEPPRSLPLVLGAVALLIVLAVVAIVGVGAAPLGGSARPGDLQVAGVDVTAGEVIEVDPSRPIPVITGPSLGATKVELSLCMLGVCPAPVESDVSGTPGQAGSAEVDLGNGRFLMGGAVAVRAVATGGPGPSVSGESAAMTTTTGFLTAPGVIAIALLLFLAAYAESSLRFLRRGRRSASATVTLVVLGAVLGIDAVLLSAVAGLAPVSVIAMIVCAAVGAAAGATGSFAARRAGRRRRYLRVAHAQDGAA